MHRIAQRTPTVTCEEAKAIALDDAKGHRDLSLASTASPEMRRAHRFLMRAAAKEWRRPTYLRPRNFS